MTLNFWILQGISGLSLGMLLFMLAAGLSLIFGLMGIVNLAHGSFYLIGAYIGLFLIGLMGNFFLAMVGAGIAIGLMGVILERVFLHRFLKDDLAQVLLTFGFVYIFGDIALLVWGGAPVSIPKPSFLEGSFPIGTISFPVYRLFVIAVGVLIAIGLWLFQEKTRVGAMVRAGVDDQEMLSVLGVNVPVLFMAIFALGAFLAAIGGVMGGAFLGVFPGVDLEILLLAFVVVIVGGVGSLRGAFVGSILVGVVDNLSKALVPELSLFTIFALMVVVLAIRPSGLFGRSMAWAER
jgi:branched-chain amino acid transport system permease protein